MPDVSDNEDAMREMLSGRRVIAVVGHSDKPHRTSYQIAHYLRRAGYVVYAVNPTVEMIGGETCYASLADIPEPVDIVNVFRRSEHLAGIVDEAIAAGITNIWTQLGVVDDTATRTAIDHGINIVVNRCIKVEHVYLRI